MPRNHVSISHAAPKSYRKIHLVWHCHKELHPLFTIVVLGYISDLHGEFIPLTLPCKVPSFNELASISILVWLGAIGKHAPFVNRTFIGYLLYVFVYVHDSLRNSFLINKIK